MVNSTRGKPGPRMADLSNTLDGRYLMAQAVDLNLSLMKWRMWPELDMARLSQTKCLLLGAGTLGMYVLVELLLNSAITRLCCGSFPAGMGRA